MEEIKEMKCNYCKVILPVYKFSINRKDKLNKSCDECREKQKIVRKTYKCEHGREKYECVECKGSTICEHGRRKRTCRDCDGSGRCHHKIDKTTCKECKGSKICEHNKDKSKCVDCGGASICEHNRIKRLCKECNGSGRCEHNIIKWSCKICDPCNYLTSIVRSRVKGALKSNKSLHSIEYLGCNIKTYREYLEPLFIDGMTWENQGDWHIDHIIPIMYSEDGNPPSLEVVIERLHYKNTQPLWAKDNISKGNRFIG
jgi:hypothetical protein